MNYTWGMVNRPKQGQDVSGDAAVIRADQNTILVAVIDGLGAGQEAARAAHAAEAVINANPDWSLLLLMQHCHAALQATRGAVIGMLRLEAAGNQATYVGVGNIGVHVYTQQPIKPISKNGIVGFQLPALLELRYTFDPGDRFVLFSDGISARFAYAQHSLQHAPQAFSELLLAEYSKITDDATVVTVQT